MHYDIAMANTAPMIEAVHLTIVVKVSSLDSTVNTICHCIP